MRNIRIPQVFTLIHKNPFSPHGDNGFDLLTQKPIYLYI